MFRRSRRILFHTAAAGSALLLVAVLILWPWSYFRWDNFHYDTRTGVECGIGSLGGRVNWYWGAYLQVTGAPRTPAGLGYSGRGVVLGEAAWSYGDRSQGTVFGPIYRCLGCEYWAWVYNGGRVYVPYSYLAVLLAITPVLWLLTRKRRRLADEMATGLCPICDYDLRAHKAGERCPECGTVIPAGLVREPMR